MAENGGHHLNWETDPHQVQGGKSCDIVVGGDFDNKYQLNAQFVKQFVWRCVEESSPSSRGFLGSMSLQIRHKIDPIPFLFENAPLKRGELARLRPRGAEIIAQD